MQKSICVLTLYLLMFALNLLLHRFRNELTHSLTNGNHFLVLYTYIQFKSHRVNCVIMFFQIHTVRVAYLPDNRAIFLNGLLVIGESNAKPSHHSNSGCLS